MAGKITVFTGPMFSRKTKSMVIDLERAVLGKRSFVAIKPDIDSRQSRSLENELNRTLSQWKVSVAEHVFSVYSPVQFSKVLLAHREVNILAIDEAQFFNESWIVEEVKTAAWDLGMDVLISGLDLDYKRQGFNQMPQLIAVADEVHKLTAICLQCGNPARFTQRIAGSDSQVEVGDKEYEARCADCYYEYRAS